MLDELSSLNIISDLSILYNVQMTYQHFGNILCFFQLLLYNCTFLCSTIKFSYFLSIFWMFVYSVINMVLYTDWLSWQCPSQFSFMRAVHNLLVQHTSPSVAAGVFVFWGGRKQPPSPGRQQHPPPEDNRAIKAPHLPHLGSGRGALFLPPPVNHGGFCRASPSS